MSSIKGESPLFNKYQKVFYNFYFNSINFPKHQFYANIKIRLNQLKDKNRQKQIFFFCNTFDLFIYYFKYLI